MRRAVRSRLRHGGPAEHVDLRVAAVAVFSFRVEREADLIHARNDEVVRVVGDDRAVGRLEIAFDRRVEVHRDQIEELVAADQRVGHGVELLVAPVVVPAAVNGDAGDVVSQRAERGVQRVSDESSGSAAAARHGEDPVRAVRRAAGFRDGAVGSVRQHRKPAGKLNREVPAGRGGLKTVDQVAVRDLVGGCEVGAGSAGPHLMIRGVNDGRRSGNRRGQQNGGEEGGMLHGNMDAVRPGFLKNTLKNVAGSRVSGGR